MQVYWIHAQEHADMSAQGYIGVTKHFDKRMKQHNWNHPNPHFANAIEKNGWDNLVKEVVLIADEDYCLEVERKLRPQENIGWNIVAGGGKPPVSRWNVGVPMSEEAKQKQREVKLGNQYCVGYKHTDEAKANMSAAKVGKPSNAKGHKRSAEAIAKMKQEHQCPHCGLVGKGNAMLRHHFKNCKELRYGS